jgi:hypothetical protein
MGEVSDRFDTIYRDFETDGLPASGPHEPEKAEIRALGRLLETIISSAVAGLERYATVAAMNAAPGTNAGELAYVYANNGSTSDPANGAYQWSGTAWVAAPWYFNAVAGVVQPLLDEMQALYDSTNAIFGDTIAQRTATAFLRAWTDEAGHVAAGIREDGAFEIYDLRAKSGSIESLDLPRLALGDAVITPEVASRYLRTFIDQYGHVSAGILTSGEWEFYALAAKTAQVVNLVVSGSITVPGISLGDAVQSVVPTPGYLQQTVDLYGHWATRLTETGELEVYRLRDHRGRDVYARVQEALDVGAANSAALAAGGGSAFRQSMISARNTDGFYPRRPMVGDTPPATVSLASTLPGGQVSLAAWNASGKWRARGGVAQQLGANPVMVYYSRRAGGNAGGYTGAGMILLETIHTGTKLTWKMRGAGTTIRAIVDGRYVSLSSTYINPDGSYWYYTLDFGGVSATRKIILECAGPQVAEVFGASGDSIVAPSTALSLVCAIGTSITEASNSWALWLMYRLGANVYNTGVGAAGVLNFGVPGRVNLRGRSNDYVLPDFSLAIDENGINDGGLTGQIDSAGTVGNLYADLSYATVFQTYYDEYRRNLDLWFTAHPNSPWIAFGPYWPHESPTDTLYTIRDAKQRALSEYRLGGFVDTLQWPLIKGNRGLGTAPAITYTSSDNTHPTEFGSEHVAEALDPFVNNLIRTLF